MPINDLGLTDEELQWLEQNQGAWTPAAASGYEQPDGSQQSASVWQSHEQASPDSGFEDMLWRSATGGARMRTPLVDVQSVQDASIQAPPAQQPQSTIASSQPGNATVDLGRIAQVEQALAQNNGSPAETSPEDDTSLEAWLSAQASPPEQSPVSEAPAAVTANQQAQSQISDVDQLLAQANAPAEDPYQSRELREFDDASNEASNFQRARSIAAIGMLLGGMHAPAANAMAGTPIDPMAVARQRAELLNQLRERDQSRRSTLLNRASTLQNLHATQANQQRAGEQERNIQATMRRGTPEHDSFITFLENRGYQRDADAYRDSDIPRQVVEQSLSPYFTGERQRENNAVRISMAEMNNRLQEYLGNIRNETDRARIAAMLQRVRSHGSGAGRPANTMDEQATREYWFQTVGRGLIATGTDESLVRWRALNGPIATLQDSISKGEDTAGRNTMGSGLTNLYDRQGTQLEQQYRQQGVSSDVQASVSAVARSWSALRNNPNAIRAALWLASGRNGAADQAVQAYVNDPRVTALASNIDRMKNSVLARRSGAAVTDQELDRLMGELSLGRGLSINPSHFASAFNQFSSYVASTRQAIQGNTGLQEGGVNNMPRVSLYQGQQTPSSAQSPRGNAQKRSYTMQKNGQRTTREMTEEEHRRALSMGWSDV